MNKPPVPVEGRALAAYLAKLPVSTAGEIREFKHPLMRIQQRATGFNKAMRDDEALIYEMQDNPASRASENYQLAIEPGARGAEWLLEIRLATAYIKGNQASRFHAENVLTYAVYGDIITDLERLYRYVQTAVSVKECLDRISAILSKVKPGHLPGMEPE